MPKPAARPRVVARRTFRTKTGERVIAELYQPVMVREDEWWCAFRITGLGKEIADRAAGNDALQAIIVAIQGLRFHLDDAAKSLRWSTGALGELGIPRLIPDSYGVTIERRLTKLVQDETTRLVREAVHARHKRSKAQRKR